MQKLKRIIYMMFYIPLVIARDAGHSVWLMMGTHEQSEEGEFSFTPDKSFMSYFLSKLPILLLITLLAAAFAGGFYIGKNGFSDLFFYWPLKALAALGAVTGALAARQASKRGDTKFMAPFLFLFGTILFPIHGFLLSLLGMLLGSFC